MGAELSMVCFGRRFFIWFCCNQYPLPGFVKSLTLWVPKYYKREVRMEKLQWRIFISKGLRTKYCLSDIMMRRASRDQPFRIHVFLNVEAFTLFRQLLLIF